MNIIVNRVYPKFIPGQPSYLSNRLTFIFPWFSGRANFLSRLFLDEDMRNYVMNKKQFDDVANLVVLTIDDYNFSHKRKYPCFSELTKYIDKNLDNIGIYFIHTENIDGLCSDSKNYMIKSDTIDFSKWAGK